MGTMDAFKSMSLDVVSNEGIFPIEMENYQPTEDTNKTRETNSADSSPLMQSDMPDLVPVAGKLSGSDIDDHAETKSSHSSSANASDLFEDLMSSLSSVKDIAEVNDEHKEELHKIASTLRKKESKLREKSNQLERRLETAESTNARLMEENGELKTEIDSLEAEISETQDRFHEEDAKELRRLRSGMAALAKTCRAFHLKLKKSERKSGQLKMQNEELKAAVKGATSANSSSSSEDENVDDKELAPRRKKSSRTGVAVVDPSEASSTSDMLTSAAIFSAVLVAGTFVVSKFK